MFVVLFHVFYLLGKLVLRRYIARRDRPAELKMSGRRRDGGVDDSVNLPYVDVGASSRARNQMNQQRFVTGDELEEEDLVTVKFSPPVYIQRYHAVKDAINDSKFRGQIKKVVEFGCAELKMFTHLKKMACVEHILFVDIDRVVLDMYQDRIQPLLVDYLHRRDTPLSVHLLEGSVTDNDKRLEGCDAVICIELVEHLYPEPFTMMPYNIFGYIQPKIAAITTPNADFNVLFGDMEGFRHPDHKFEWTREQFEDWANNIVSRFPQYQVKFQGIGYGPSGTEHLGACSQMAVFHKISDSNTEKVSGVEGLFSLVKSYDYPYEVDNRTDEQKILDDASYYINKFSIQYDDEDVCLKRIIKSMTNFCISVEALREILIINNWTVIDREDGPYVRVPPDSFSENSFAEHILSTLSLQDNEWDAQPGPSNEYINDRGNEDINVVDDEDWDSEPQMIVSNFENLEEEAASSHINDDVNTIDVVNADDEVNMGVELNVDAEEWAAQQLPYSSFESTLMQPTTSRRIEDLHSESHIVPNFENLEEGAASSHINDDVNTIDLVSTDDEVNIGVELNVDAEEWAAKQLPYSSFKSTLMQPTTSKRKEEIKEDLHSESDIVSDSENREEKAASSHINDDVNTIDLVSTDDDEVSIVHEVNVNDKVNVVVKKDCGSEPHIIASNSENREEEVASPDAEALTANSTASIYPNDICLDDIATESRSIEFANSEVDESSILISSYSETKDSENSETGKESSLAETTSTCVDKKIANITATFSRTKKENKSKSSMSHSADLTISKNNSMCQLSNKTMEEISASESTITSSTKKKKNKKLKLYHSSSSNNLNEKFDEPQYASSPYILSSIVSKKKKVIEGTEHSNTSSINSSNENLIMCKSESSKNLLKRSYDSSSSSNESVIAESNRSDCSPTANSESPEKLRHHTGAIPKNLSLKLSMTKISVEETKLSTSPDLPVSPPNSWSPEIMDSGYPNSNSPPDLSPEFDLSSIVYNHSDSESPSMADIPKGFPELPAENRDLANNNLDDEGNYMGPEENRQINDLHPLIHVLENDIENENDIFLMRDEFPIWLLRILQRLPLPEENFDE